MPGPLYSLDPSKRASGSRQDWTVGEKRAWEWCAVKWGPGPTLDQGPVNDVRSLWLCIYHVCIRAFLLFRNYIFPFEGD